MLEIGPGEGFLTVALLATGARVVAVEKDVRLINFLNKKFHKEITAKKLVLIHDDILNFLEAKSYLPDGKAGHLEAPYKLIANIPYYLTGQIIRQFLTAENQPQAMTLMLQKEVAQRIVAKNNKESLLSISVKAYGDPRYVRTVPAAVFWPKPKVNSAILAIENISRRRFRGLSEKHFFGVLRAGFAKKRKKLLSNLSAIAPKQRVAEAFAALSLPENMRAEDLSTEGWFALARELAK